MSIALSRRIPLLSPMFRACALEPSFPIHSVPQRKRPRSYWNTPTSDLPRASLFGPESSFLLGRVGTLSTTSRTSKRQTRPLTLGPSGGRPRRLALRTGPSTLHSRTDHVVGPHNQSLSWDRLSCETVRCVLVRCPLSLARHHPGVNLSQTSAPRHGGITS